MRRQEINYEKASSKAEKIKKRGKDLWLTDEGEELNQPDLSTQFEHWAQNQPDLGRYDISILRDNISLSLGGKVAIVTFDLILYV